jgi:hypothetical protein
MAENVLERAGLEYLARGWSVIPLRSTGSVEDRKKPSLESWKQYQKRLPTEVEVRGWWREQPAANVGIVTGKVSGLVVIDNDGPNCSELFRQQGIYLPKTAAVQTGSGCHIYYAHPAGREIENRVALLKDGKEKTAGGSQVDLRGDGGYVVAPPSVHGSGRVYQWAIPPTDPLAPLPDDIISLLDREQSECFEKGEDWVSQVVDGVMDGQRHDVAAKLAGYFLRVNNCHEESAYFSLRTWNALNKPPLPDIDLRRTVGSIAQRERKKREQDARKNPSYTRLEVLDGAEWADAVKDTVPRRGIAVSIPTLEDVGGLVTGDVVVLAGGAGMGKTTHACRIIAEACIEKKISTIFFSTEMTRFDVARWVAAILKGCSVPELPTNIPKEILDQFRASPIKIVDAGSVRIEDIETVVRSAIGTRLVIVDHLTRIVTSHRESRTLEVGEVARRLKSLAKDCQLTVLELCQLNREGNDGTRPDLRALRDSGEIEQECDAVVFLWTAEKNLNGPSLRVAFYLAKNRHGAVTEVVADWNRALKTIEVLD